jgi:hypothetical protein
VFPADWRVWLLSATARAGVATGFLLVPTVRVQLGDASLAALCLVLAGGLAAALAGHLYVARERARRDLAADAVAVVALVPAAIVAASIHGADDRFGGRTENALAALATATMIFAIVALVARADERITFADASVGALGGALTLAAVIGNTPRFASGDVWQALSLAWMVAAASSVVFAVSPDRLRAFIPVAVYASFSLVIVLLPADTPSQSVNTGSLPIMALIATGAIMLLIAPGKHSDR